MLVDSLDGDEAAPVYLLRLWGHCQLRRAWIFTPLPAAGLKALCHYPGSASKLESALVASGFITRSEETLTVCGWDEYNAGIIANWTNGKLGGRPRKIPPATPNKTHGLPMAIPSLTHGEPIGEDRKGEDGNLLFSEPENKPTKKFQAPTLEEVTAYALTLSPPFRDAEKFMKYYEMNGWKAGKNPMKDWKAAVGYWHCNDTTSRTAKPRPKETADCFGIS